MKSDGLFNLNRTRDLLVLWWVVLFADPAVRRSQPARGRRGRAAPTPAHQCSADGPRLIWTTLISAVIFAVAMWAYQAGYFNIERLSKLMGMPF